MQEIVKVLHKIQKQLKAPKNQRNEFGKYNYRSCEDILEAVKQLLPEGYVVMISDKVINIGERYYIEATVSFSDGKDTVTTTALAREATKQTGMNDSQLTGSTSSYARKYALNGLFCIDDTKDSDFSNTHSQSQSRPLASKPMKIHSANQIQSPDDQIWVKLKGLIGLAGQDEYKKIKEEKGLKQVYETQDALTLVNALEDFLTKEDDIIQ